jgi:hypothetical protein
MINLILTIGLFLNTSILQSPCEKFYNTNIKALEFSKAQVVKKYEKEGFVYIDLKKQDNKVVAFTLRNHDKSGFMKKVKVGEYVSKAKDELVINRIVVLNEGASADVFKHVLTCE